MCYVVEAWDTKHDQLNVTDTVDIIGVKASSLKHSTTDGEFSVRPQEGAVSVLKAESWAVAVVTELLPDNEIFICVISGL